MKCSDARHLIHLSVGDDTLKDEEQILAEHLHGCSDCRSYNAGMVDAMQLLYDFRNDSAVATKASVWPALEQQIQERQSSTVSPVAFHQEPQRQFNGGVVALCACSLVLAFVTIVHNLPVNDTMANQPMPPGYMNVNNGAFLPMGTVAPGGNSVMPVSNGTHGQPRILIRTPVNPNRSATPPTTGEF